MPFSFSLSPFSFFFPLSPSPSNKPTFLYKFFTPFSLVLSILFPFASEEQQYPPSKRKPQNPATVKNETQQPKTTWISPFERKPRNPAAVVKIETHQLTEALPLSLVKTHKTETHQLWRPIRPKPISCEDRSSPSTGFVEFSLSPCRVLCICDFWFGSLWVLIWTSMGFGLAIGLG